MPTFTITMRDRATVDITATVEVEANSYEHAVERLETEIWDIDWDLDKGLGWFDQHHEIEYEDDTLQ